MRHRESPTQGYEVKYILSGTDWQNSHQVSPRRSLFWLLRDSHQPVVRCQLFQLSTDPVGHMNCPCVVVVQKYFLALGNCFLIRFGRLSPSLEMRFKKGIKKKEKEERLNHYRDTSRLSLSPEASGSLPRATRMSPARLDLRHLIGS